MGKRVVYAQDAIPWLKEQGVISNCSFITSLPDSCEFNSITFDEWQVWFVAAAEAVLRACPDDGVVIFFQTDVRREGLLVDKSFLINKAAEACGFSSLWHAIVCRKPAGCKTFALAAYSHMLCFSRAKAFDPSRAPPDVIPDGGAKAWKRAMGVNACMEACKFIMRSTPSRTIIDPFCGVGTTLAVANHLGLDAIGVELFAKRARKAQKLQYDQLVAPPYRAQQADGDEGEKRSSVRKIHL
eukprot:TRINITY_DN4935_c0_g2_i1.p1 TRINITY_DN4935_c0_g2~~TRINITY_DN4935_c0_g2_i1.p1  ORF type:complete len:241 (+),score=37.59 TRINITY_DN4935_c0_g2_i1:79-801(+)